MPTQTLIIAAVAGTGRDDAAIAIAASAAGANASAAGANPAADTAADTTADASTVTLPLRLVNFQGLTSLTIFVAENAGNDVSALTALALLGEGLAPQTDMAAFGKKNTTKKKKNNNNRNPKNGNGNGKSKNQSRGEWGGTGGDGTNEHEHEHEHKPPVTNWNVLVCRAAAASSGSLVELLSEHDEWTGPHLDAFRDNSGKCPLHHAAWRGSEANLVALLDRGADINAYVFGAWGGGASILECT